MFLWIFLMGITLIGGAVNAESAPTAAGLFYGEVSSNFIMRWHFQERCDFVFDPRTLKWAWPTTTKPGGARFDPRLVKPGSIVFVRDIPLFFQEMHPDIEHPYIIVTHGEFRDTCEDSYLAYLDDDKIIAWFGIHPCRYGHPKYYPLPLGAAQSPKPLSTTKKEKFNTLFKHLRETTPKTELVYLNFSDDSNPERQKLRKQLEKASFCSTQIERLEFAEYIEQMAKHKFALSPRGWGPDCYRTWEALLVGTIPIVRRGVYDKIDIRARKQGSQLDTLYHNLPVLIVDSWSELTEEFLEKKYKEMTSRKYYLGRLYVEYWFDKMYAVRDAFFLVTKRSKRK